MINWLSVKIAKFIVKNDDTADFEVLQYGYGLLLNEIFSDLALFFSALLLGVVWQMLLTVFLYTVMRLVIGGGHANSRLVCFITYTFILYLCIFLAANVTISIPIVVLLYGINLTNILLYAPGDTEEQPIIKGRFKRKIIGLLLLTSFYGLSFVVGGPRYIANTLVIMPVINCFCVHPIVYKIFGCKKYDSKECRHA